MASSGCAELAARAPPLSPSFVRLHHVRSSIASGRRLFTTAARLPSSALRALSPSRSSWGRVPRSTGSSRCAFVASGCGSVPKRSRLPPRGPRRPRRSTKPERSFRGRLFPSRPPLRSKRAKSSVHLLPVYSVMFSERPPDPPSSPGSRFRRAASPSSAAHPLSSTRRFRSLGPSAPPAELRSRTFTPTGRPRSTLPPPASTTPRPFRRLTTRG